MIASKLKEENPLWNYIGQQCEDKFKDLRKHYVKAKDQNEKSSGLPVATCKFYDEMDEVLGDKPSIKPLSIASTLKKRSFGIQDFSNAISVGSSSEGDNEHDSCNSTSKKRKKCYIEKNIENLLMIRAEDLKRKKRLSRRDILRHIKRMERQDRTIEVYQSAMNRLLEKL